MRSAALLLLLAACSAPTAGREWFPTMLRTLERGDTEAEVAEALGSPPYLRIPRESGVWAQWLFFRERRSGGVFRREVTLEFDAAGQLERMVSCRGIYGPLVPEALR